MYHPMLDGILPLHQPHLCHHRRNTNFTFGVSVIYLSLTEMLISLSIHQELQSISIPLQGCRLLRSLREFLL